MTGTLIVIDGSDGAGKKTQVHLLKQRLEKEGRHAKTLDFPQYSSFFGKLVARYLRGEFGSLKEVKPELASVLYALDRYAQAEKIRRWLHDDCVVILDRYVESNMAYQSAKIKEGKQRDEFVAWVREMEYEHLHLPRPNMVVYLCVPVKVSSSLLKGRPQKHGSDDDIHEQDKKFQQKVVDAYMALADKFRWPVIDCAPDGMLLPKEAISEEIYNLVAPVLQSSKSL